MYYGKHLLSIPFDCAFVAGGQHQDTVRQTSRSRKRRAAMAEATASFDITLDYFDQLFDEHLPPSRRLVGKYSWGVLCCEGCLMLWRVAYVVRFSVSEIIKQKCILTVGLVNIKRYLTSLEKVSRPYFCEKICQN